MARGRSKSLVQKIAADVPIYKADQLNLGTDKLERTTYKLSRSKSLASYYPNPKHTSEKPQELQLYPFDNDAWAKYTEDFNYDCLLNDDDIMAINNHQIDELLNFQDNCVKNNREILSLIKETIDISTSVQDLLTKYHHIASETSEFDTESNKLLTLQTTYDNKLAQINNYLKHFESLDSITKSLSRGGYNLIVRKSQFFKVDILQELDSSLELVNSHSEFKDVEIYKSRFRQCMTRSLTLIKNYLNDELKALSDRVNNLLNENREGNLDMLIYAEFNNYLATNDTFNQWIQEIVTRIPNHLEYKGLLLDIMNNYFKLRLHLSKSYIAAVPESDTKNKSLVQISQDQISFYKRLIGRETNLFKSFFANQPMVLSIVYDEFHKFLKDILDPLYDSLRQFILRESNISSLCQLTTLLQKYYEFDENEVLVEHEEGINYGELFQPILEDVQSRLIFRIQVYVDETLMKYKPKAEDLKIGNRKSAPSDTHVHSLDIDYQENLFPDVYLPLGKALTLLSGIYELINHIVFDDLAHYIVHCCIELLKGEFYKLSVAHLGLIDAKLHYLKNLIILRIQIANFDIKFVRNDYSIDFTSGLNDAWKTISSGELFLNKLGFVDMVKKSVPKIVNNMVDANAEIELELNNAVNDFIKECTNMISEPIIIDSEVKRELILKNPNEVNSQFKHNLITRIPYVYKQISIFIDDTSITKYLMNNLTNLIVITYDNFYKFFLENIDNIDNETKLNLTEIMEVDTLFGFISDVMTDLYDQEDVNKVVFNENVLKELQLDD
jgi:hypothetical protein